MLFVVLLAPAVKAQQNASAPHRCLIVSAIDGGKFQYRDACAYITKKHTFKNSELAKIAKQGVEVIRLGKDATDTEVHALTEPCRTPPVVVTPLTPCCCQCGPRIIPIGYGGRVAHPFVTVAASTAT